MDSETAPKSDSEIDTELFCTADTDLFRVALICDLSVLVAFRMPSNKITASVVHPQTQIQSQIQTQIHFQIQTQTKIQIQARVQMQMQMWSS